VFNGTKDILETTVQNISFPIPTVIEIEDSLLSANTVPLLPAINNTG
jgi:hypothetical protein